MGVCDLAMIYVLRQLTINDSADMFLSNKKASGLLSKKFERNRTLKIEAGPQLQLLENVNFPKAHHFVKVVRANFFLKMKIYTP